MELNPDKKNTSRPSPWGTEEPAVPAAHPASLPDSLRDSKRAPAVRSEGDQPHAKRYLKFGAAALAIGLAAAGYYFLTQRPGVSVAIEFSKPDQILAGQPFTVSVSFSNSSDKILKGARLSVLVPEGISFVNGAEGQRVMEQNIGDLGPGSINQQSFQLIALGGVKTVKHIDAKLEYEIAGSSAQFESESGVDLPIGQSAGSLTLDAPQSVFSSANFGVTIHYQNNSNQDLKNFKVKADYPPVFTMIKASADPSIGNNQWDIGTLAKGDSGDIVITGTLVGPDRSYFSFHAVATADYQGQSYPISDQTAAVAIAVSPLSITPTVNDQPDYVSRIGDALRYSLAYKNNSSVTLQGVMIKATLTGELLDFSSAQTSASFDQISRTFTWITANTPALASLAPGQEGSVELGIKLKGAFPIKRISDKNYSISLDAEIESPTVPEGTQAPKTMSVAKLQTKVSGMLKLQAKGLWRDAASGVLNKGPYPPRVNQPTQYTAHWIVTNYATDATDAEVGAYLQSGARWTGVVKSNIDAKPEYDSSTGKVTWHIGNIAATKGVISVPAETIFQVEVTPASNQIGNFVTFLGRTDLKGTDSFTGASLGDSAQELATQLLDDTTIGQNVDRRVQP